MKTPTTKRMYPTHLRTTMTGFLCEQRDAGNVGTFASPEIVDCPKCRERMTWAQAAGEPDPARTLAYLALDLIRGDTHAGHTLALLWGLLTAPLNFHTGDNHRGFCTHQ